MAPHVRVEHLDFQLFFFHLEKDTIGKSTRKHLTPISPNLYHIFHALESDIVSFHVYIRIQNDHSSIRSHNAETDRSSPAILPFPNPFTFSAYSNESRRKSLKRMKFMDLSFSNYGPFNCLA